MPPPPCASVTFPGILPKGHIPHWFRTLLSPVSSTTFVYLGAEKMECRIFLFRSFHCEKIKKNLDVLDRTTTESSIIFIVGTSTHKQETPGTLRRRNQTVAATRSFLRQISRDVFPATASVEDLASASGVMIKMALVRCTTDLFTKFEIVHLRGLT